MELENNERSRTTNRLKNLRGDPNDQIIIRIRAKRRMLIRLHEIVAYDRAVYGERGWNISDVCREAILEHMQRRAAELRADGYRLVGPPSSEFEEFEHSGEQGTYILKIQATRSLMDRLQTVIAHERDISGQKQRGAQSRVCVEALEQYLTRRERELAQVKLAEPFGGEAPRRKRRKKEQAESFAAN